jgi:hypothetical protein
MKKKPYVVIASLSVAVFLLAQSHSAAQEKGKMATKGSKGAARVIVATLDKTGQHPGSVAISGPARIVCLSATSNAQNPQPRPTCFVQAPGYSGNLDPPKGEAGASGPGTVILNCNGQGDLLHCSASVQ